MNETIRIVEEHVLSFDELRDMIVDNTYTRQVDEKLKIINDIGLSEFFLMYLNSNDIDDIDDIVDIVEDTPIDELLIAIQATRINKRLMNSSDLDSLILHNDFEYFIACDDSLLTSFIGSIGSLYIVAIEKYMNEWSSALEVSLYDSFANVPLEHIEYLENLQDRLEEEE